MATLNTAQQLRATWSSNTTASRATTTHISALMANAEAECAKHLRDSELDADQYLFDDWSVLVVLDDRVATFNNAGDAQDWIKANNKVDPKPVVTLDGTTVTINKTPMSIHGKEGKQAAQINALRELVRAEQARTQALLDLQAQLPPNMSQTAFEFVRGYTRILATSKDWREVGLYELAEVFDRIEKA